MILNEEQIDDAADAIAEITNRDGLTNQQMATLKTHLRGLIVSVIEEPNRFRGVPVEPLPEAPRTEPLSELIARIEDRDSVYMDDETRDYDKFLPRTEEATEPAGLWRCSSCGDAYDFETTEISRWRWTGTAYEHKCPGSHPQAGHFPAEWFGGPKPTEPARCPHGCFVHFDGAGEKGEANG